MNKFHCDACGTDFEAKRNFYAHCPKCGKNAHRVFINETATPDSENSSEPITETVAKEEAAPVTKTEDEVKPSEGNRNTTQQGSRRIVVRRVKKEPEPETTKRTAKQPSTSPINKKVTITKGVTPTVKKKVTTTRQRKEEREGPETSTHWSSIGKISGFNRRK